MSKKLITIVTILVITIFSQTGISQTLKIGSKHFNESYILAEIMAQLLEDRGYRVERKYGLGGTIICYQALVNGAIDLYPEYSGTIAQAILKLEPPVSFSKLQGILKKQTNLELLDTFGFNNTYALTVTSRLARKLKLKTITDLRKYPELRFGLSYEFLQRKDGWNALARVYKLRAIPTGMEHVLSYQAMAQGKIDVMDVYSTDAEILKYNLVLLEDDLHFFPTYLAAPLVRKNLPPEIKAILSELAHTIDEKEMQRLNALAAIEGKSFAEVARIFLQEKNLLKQDNEVVNKKWATLAYRTWTHLKLTVLALLAAMAVAMPFAVIIYRIPTIARPILYFSGLMQTIPSLALLAFMIPFFGIGAKPALIALFLYALLPILRNTYVALNAIDPVLKKVSIGMGLTNWQRIRHIDLPLAIPHILAGIRTAAVILIGTATLAAIIGAGGLGEYIFTGVSLNDPVIIMWGAIPAALLAILVELIFEGLERLIVPKHLLQKLK
ncbi:MAG: ABC transporter permease subunit [Calditrichaeota bacterium]|nr:MAG: ABC transporter permease subunit [Calditrichota bacterium]